MALSPHPLSESDTDSDVNSDDVIAPPSHACNTFESDSESDIDEDMPLAELARARHDDTPLAELARARINRARNNPAQRKDTTPFPTTIPPFEPLQMDAARCTAKGRPNYYHFRSMPKHTPFYVFKKFISLSTLKKIATNTNAYAEIKRAGVGHRWKAVTWQGIQCFFRIILYMGVYRCPRLEDYWDLSGRAPNHNITKAMNLMRFQQIKRFIHICHPTSDNGKTFFFNKLEPLLSQVLEDCSRLWYPSSRVSADEMMVMNYGRCGETVRMRNKPIGSGFKIWALCDRGYMFTAFPNSTKDKWRYCETYKNNLCHSSAVVAQLCDVLPRNVPFSTSPLKQIYTVFMDNFFATLKLFSLLRGKDIGAVGTVRSNATGFPRQLVVRGKHDLKLNWNTLGGATCENGQVLALTWIDNGAVQMLTTVHNIGEGHTVERMRKRPKFTSTNGPRVHQVFGTSATKNLRIPLVVDDCNFNMGGVDIADQLRAVYTSHLPSRRVWMPMLFWILDTVGTNSYKLLTELDRNWRGKHKDFTSELSWEMVLGSFTHSEPSVRRSAPAAERQKQPDVPKARGQLRLVDMCATLTLGSPCLLEDLRRTIQ